MLIGPSTSTLVLCNIAGPNHVEFMLISKHRHLRRKRLRTVITTYGSFHRACQDSFQMCNFNTNSLRNGLISYWNKLILMCVLTVPCLCFGHNELNWRKRWQCSGRLHVQPRDEAALQLSVGREATWASSASVTQFVPAVIHYVLLWGRLAAFAPTLTLETGQKGLWRNKGKKIPAKVEGIAWWDQGNFNGGHHWGHSWPRTFMMQGSDMLPDLNQKRVRFIFIFKFDITFWHH